MMTSYLFIAIYRMPELSIGSHTRTLDEQIVSVSCPGLTTVSALHAAVSWMC